MSHSTDTLSSSPALENALAWLAAAPAEDPLRDLVPLRTHLAAVDAMGVAPLQLLKILELFQPRVNAVSLVLRPLLLDATLPIARRLRTIAQGLIDVHGGIAAAFARVLREADAVRLASLHRSPAMLCGHALGNLAQQGEIALLIAAPAPPELWRRAQALFHQMLDALPPGSTLPAGVPTVERHLKSMLALAAAQPESFTPREIDFLTGYLHEFAPQVEVLLLPPAERETWFWINEGSDQPPAAVTRRAPPAGGRTIYFSCHELGRTVLEQLEHLGAGESPETLGLPPSTGEFGQRQVLRQAALRWISPPRRHLSRRGSSNRIQVCTDLRSLWRYQRGETGSAANAVGISATDWMMLNESPGGLAVMHVSGETGGLVAGSALAVQPEADQPWGLCVVRWARSDNPEHIELGLELLAFAGEAVRLVRRNGAAPTDSGIEAFRLPPLPALHRNETLLLTRGGCPPGKFTLVSENRERIQLTECAAGNLVIQTASVELFEFSRDFSPSPRP